MVAFVRDEAKAGRSQDMGLFSEIVRLFMGHRRKTLSACTKSAHGRLAVIDNWPEIFAKCSIDSGHRPEQLPPEDYIAIANACSARVANP
jgi:16S rRNA A1518/A1519 N6-dimethyltransferase RsmA/KsgA/DIM1 with predicted DNA glycosylase/AP lyase activity